MQIYLTLWQRIGSRIGILTLLLSTLLLPAPVMAQTPELPAVAPAAIPGLQIAAEGGSVRLQYAPGAQTAGLTDLPRVPYGGYYLPMQGLTVAATGQPPAEGMATLAAVQSFTSVPYTGELTPAPPLDPPALDWNPDPAQRPVFTPHLPTAPFFLLHEGIRRGQHLAVFVFSPIYQDPTTGELRQVENFDVQVAGATLPAELDPTAAPDNAALFAPVPALADALGPTNPYANSAAVKIFVDKSGMQQVTGAQIAGAGLNAPAVNNLRLFFRGTEVPLHVVDTNGNGKLDAADAVRFYVDQVGDRYNAQSVYWLVSGSQGGLRMGARAFPAAPGAQARSTAYEAGRFFAPTFYDSTMPGYDGDHYFNFDFRTSPSDVAPGSNTTVSLDHVLPLIGNNSLPTVLTLHVTPFAISTYGKIAHRLQLATTGYTYTDAADEWIVELSADATHVNVARRFTLTKAAAQWTIALLKDTVRLGVKLDTIDYLLPVQLNFGGKGAIFQGVDGTWRYQLSNTPDPKNVAGGRTLYDITDPAAPQRLTIPTTTSFEFRDGPTAARYLLTGEGTLVAPAAVVAHTPVNMGAKSGAHALYIAPKSFHAALQPLVNLRTSQNYQVRVIDAQSVYDAWSWGMMDPAAIRSFLKLTVGTWSPAPIAATLVGDASWDPHNYLGYNNANLVPAYLLDVDPYIHVTACENCFGQLDGDDPLSEKAFLPDIWIGRFPAATVDELNAIVAKIILYETDDAPDQLWRRNIVQISDDYIKPNGSADSAGNFPESIEEVIASMPEGIRNIRHYYMAATDLSGLPTPLRTFLTSLMGYFTANPDNALQRTIDLMNTDPGLVTYTGHSNHYQWARTETADPSVSGYLMGLNEVRDLRNNDHPFIVLSMTCYTSQFPKPENRHYTLDEHLFIYDRGGAAAVWGPAGLSVAHGHDQLQRGFYSQLWKSPRQAAKLGALTEAGYNSIISTPFTADCCADVNHTFLLLGDPLTPARVAPYNAIQMPLVQRVLAR